MSYFQMLLSAFKTSEVTNAVKSYFKDIVLSVKGKKGSIGHNNSFVDSSSNALTITKIGNVAPGNFSPFNPEGWSTYFPAAGSNLEITTPAACSLGTVDFTLETWINLDTFRATANLNGQNITQSIIFYHGPVLLNITDLGKLKFIYNAIGEDALISTKTIQSNVWTHIAITREGNIFSMYIDGVKETSNIKTVDINSTAANIFIGNASLNAYSYHSQFNGFISNLRLIKNQSIYTANFTPSTVPLVKNSNTALLLFQDNRQVDNSNNAFAINGTGTAVIYLKSPFASSVKYSKDLHSCSAYFDGASYLTTATAVLANQFQFETWIYPNDVDYVIAGTGSSTSNEWNIGVASATYGIYFYYGNYGVNQTVKYTGIIPKIKQWSHIAIVRGSDNVINFYLNGKKLTTTIFNQNTTWVETRTFNSAVTVNIGGNNFNGHLSNTRLLIDTSTYSADFTPPLTPFTSNANTKFLLKYENASITDVVNKNDLATVGNVKMSTGIKKFNIDNSMYFDGTGDWLLTPNDEKYIFNLPSNLFTIEAWINPSSTPAYSGICGSRANGAAHGWCIFVKGDFTFCMGSLIEGVGWAERQLSPIKINPNVWTHVALVKDSTGYIGYVNGVAGAKVVTAAGLNYQADQALILGAAGSQGESPFFGYIEDFRITRSVVYDGSFTAPTLPASIKTDLNDPDFNKVAVLIKADTSTPGNNNVFIDSSINNLTVTKNGNVSQGSFSPYSPNSWSGYFNSTTDNITATIPDGLGAGDFTVEYWVKHSKFVNWITHFCSTRGGTGFSCGTQATAQLVWYSSGAEKVRGITTMDVNTWYHVAYTRTNGVIKGYLNGVQDGTTGTDNTNFSDPSFFIGCLNGGAERFQGNISNLRVVKGTAVYTANFTVPVNPLTAITNTSLLTLQDNRFKDNSINAYALTLFGIPKISNNSPFNKSISYDPITQSGSIYFNGTNGYLSMPDNANYALGIGDFTIESWVNYSSVAGTQPLMQTGALNFSSNDKFYVAYSANKLIINAHNGGSGYAYCTFTPAVGTWYHIALTRVSGVIQMFINGVKQTVIGLNTFNNYNLNQSGVLVGAMATPAYFNGYISNFRFIKGTSLYTNSFTPSTDALTAIANTQLLLLGTNAQIKDMSKSVNIETLGTFKTSTVVSKFNEPSMQFDGTANCFIKLPPNEIIFGAQDFTIEFHYYKLAASGVAARLFQTGDGDIYTGVNISDDSGSLSVYLSIDGGTWAFSGNAGVIPLNTWNHIVIRRAGGVVNVFINGIIKVTFNAAATLFHSATHVPIIGGQTGGRSINGHLQDFRITLGKSRYTCEPTQEL